MARIDEEGDHVGEEELDFSNNPICPCGAGPCRRVVLDSGRAYLICCIKKGFGACGFFKWVDMDNLKDLIDQYLAQTLEFQTTSDKHVQVLAEFTASYSRLKTLRGISSHMRNMLRELSTLIGSSEGETLRLAAICKELGDEVGESQKRVVETGKELGDAVEWLTKSEGTPGEAS